MNLSRSPHVPSAAMRNGGLAFRTRFPLLHSTPHFVHPLADTSPPSPMTVEHHLVVITGANRGFGASAAHSYVAHSGAQKVSFVLVGRNQQGLQAVLDSLPSSNNQVTVKGIVVADVDLANVDQFDKNLTRIEDAISSIRNESLQSQVPYTLPDQISYAFSVQGTDTHILLGRFFSNEMEDTFLLLTNSGCGYKVGVD